MIPLSAPYLSDNEHKLLQACLDSGWVSSAGPWVAEFETTIATQSKTSHAVALSSGTAALHLALHMLNPNPNEYVIIPNLSFVASANAVKYLQAEPILMDTDPTYWQMDLDLLEGFLSKHTHQSKGDCFFKDRRIAAILCVHILGYATNMERLCSIASNYNIPLIEDAAEAVGSTYNGTALGSFGKMGCFSFNGNKIITTGGGGAVITNHEAYAKRIRHLSSQAKKSGDHYFHDEVGYNYRLSSLQASLGLAQFQQLDHILEKKKGLAHRYRQHLSSAVWPSVHPKCDPNHWLNTLLVKDPEHLRQILHKHEIQSRPLWYPLNKLPMYKDCTYIQERDISNFLFQHALSIPSSPILEVQDQKRVIDLVAPHLL